MAQFIIPTFADPFWRQTTILDGVPYALEFSFSGRERAYYLAISATDGTPLAKGVKVLCNRPLLGAGRVNPLLPPGELVAAAVGDSSPPGMGELGAGLRVQLVYLDAAEARRLPLPGR